MLWEAETKVIAQQGEEFELLTYLKYRQFVKGNHENFVV